MSIRNMRVGMYVFLGDERKDRIVGHRKFKLKLQGGRIRTLWVFFIFLHWPEIYLSTACHLLYRKNLSRRSPTEHVLSQAQEKPLNNKGIPLKQKQL